MTCECDHPCAFTGNGPCHDGDVCPDARRFGKVHPAPSAPERCEAMSTDFDYQPAAESLCKSSSDKAATQSLFHGIPAPEKCACGRDLNHGFFCRCRKEWPTQAERDACQDCNPMGFVRAIKAMDDVRKASGIKGESSPSRLSRQGPGRMEQGSSRDS